MRRLLAAATMSVALLSAAACSDSTGASSVEGTYSLRTINGSGLPQFVGQLNDGTNVEVTAGTVTVNSDGSFSDRTDYRFTLGSQVATDFDVATGVWNRSGNTITFTPDDPQTQPYSMTISGSSLTQVIDDFQSSTHFEFVYRR